MTEAESKIAEEVAQVISDFQTQRTGYAPKAVSVVLSGDTLVVTLHEALSPAERLLTQSPEGSVQVQEFHRQLFSTSSAKLREEINRITGRAVREAVAEIEPSTGTVLHAFTTGTMVQIFLLAKKAASSIAGGAQQPKTSD